ncbi:MAG: tRNA (adenosine(37)-N6)-threonylcarbamoyltransferase complex dimerization subunit type 1 TsaB [Alphaproteobacteria bacterium]|nr:tRNA (adenosine(37)-N6)-threonylcarbamoyltransferase complex dimerization subunit type 1 TsaB [Alphaproteobacteria bacterium]
MRILAFDAALAGCSAAIWCDSQIEASRAQAMARGQSEALLAMVRAVLADAGQHFTDLDGLAVTVGPGSFTGLRAGLAAARGMALASRLPLIGVTTFEVLAASAREAIPTPGAVLVLIDTHRRDVYAQAFDAALRPMGDGRVLAPDDAGRLLALGPVTLAGDAQALVAPGLVAGGWSVTLSPAVAPDARRLAALAAERLARGAPADMPAPLYLRPPEATPALLGGKLRP